jgi:hypothetical protein
MPPRSGDGERRRDWQVLGPSTVTPSVQPGRFHLTHGADSPRIDKLEVENMLEALGCFVVRRISDDAGRSWRVREFRSTSGIGLFFRCDVPGVRAETRAALAPLESMDEDRLVDLLQAGGE